MYMFPIRRGQPYTESAPQTPWYRACKAAAVTGCQFQEIHKRAINEAKERPDATEFAGHTDPRATHPTTSPKAKLKPLRREYHLHPLALAE